MPPSLFAKCVPSPYHRVVITGMGAMTNLGQDAPSTWNAMRSGVSGITEIEDSDFERYSGNWPVRIAGQIRNLDYSAYLEAREARRLDRCTVIGLGAAHEAVKDSGIDFGVEDPLRCGVVMGSGIGGIKTIEDGLISLTAKGAGRVSPFTVPRLMVNALTGNISIRFNLRGPASAHATACASSGHAISDAMWYIRRGQSDIMVAGGAEAAITPLCMSAFSIMKALSTRNDDPQHASRPFDVDRDGFVLSEGGAAFMLESLEHALARGARIYGELVGCGNSSDAAHITAPDPEGRGAARSMVVALEDAGLEPQEIGYVNAHGTSTPLGDRAEVSAVFDVFGDHARKSAGGTLLMSSTKSMHGHCLGASGAVEMIGCLHAVRDSIVAPTTNLDEPDEGFDLDLVPHHAREQAMRYSMNNTFGFGGHNVTLIIGRYDD
jgi:3-oxoacyl-[acyl-carrier-protein] synthase II